MKFGRACRVIGGFMFKWIKTVWRGTEPVEFVSSFGIDESVSRLCAVTRRNTFLSQFDMNECVAPKFRSYSRKWLIGL